MTNTTINSIKKTAVSTKDLPRDGYILSKIIDEVENITFKNLFIDLDRVINRLITLCNTRNQFKDISSLQERKYILEKLKLVKDKIKKGDNFLTELDNLKLEIRHFAYIDYTKLYATDIKMEVDKLRIEKNKLVKEKNELIKAVKTVSNNVEKSKINIEQSKDNQNSLKNLGRTIEKHNDQLSQQKIKHKQYNDEIKKYRNEKSAALKEVENIKEEAKNAMKLGEASGISAALQAQYNEIKGKKQTGFKSIFNIFIGARIWALGALLFGIIAIGLGIWLGASGDLTNSIIVARISLIFISLTGAWFCAGQYVKISNIATDYAYKVSLTKSIVAFSEQLKNSDATDTSYQDYIKKILDEIHQHPLRNYKQQESVTPIEKIIEKVLERIPKKNSND
ncbi:stage II sporulation protein M [Bathymodiolus thermophilus thioautotrophic gill symbiont]|uniref:Uncharacterized protein n=1 Tax=Bathymodiolus thermophilus thioautotrophic gill symbiont TaxID=2360 RepID=A0A1J5TXV9_9GAMM|nr:stage II sporulation protein M [Bathymodiolus thermophilus thioautotrophic gill symbiont]OIR25691.1 hypothetical protein BGC33_07545 [Bathymodiolus thermophilus thioautotrophic gill symbiont]